MSAYPIVVCLPGGVQARVRITHVVEVDKNGDPVLAQLVQSPPQYELRDGTTVDLDVEIPNDLAAHWFWFGSALTSDDGLLLVSTATYPPPGIASARGSCFDVARQLAAGMQRRQAGITRRQASGDEALTRQVRALTLTQMELF